MKKTIKLFSFLSESLLLSLALASLLWNTAAAELMPQTQLNYQLDFKDSDSEQSEKVDPIKSAYRYNSFEEESGWSNRLWGQPYNDRLLLGMWTQHLEEGDDQENNNQLLGMVYGGYYVGTFINTHSDRVVSAGWQRMLYSSTAGNWSVEAGYRAGIMYGYKKYLRMFETDFFPMFQTLLDFSYRNVGLELSWAGVVLTAGFYYKI